MSLQSATDSIKAKAANASEMGATVKFNCGDDGAIFIDANSSPATVSNDDNDADCTIALDLETLEELIAGDLDATAAFMQGKLKIEGDMSIAMKLSSLF